MNISLDDRQQIMDLVSRYNMANDHVEPGAWAETFADDGVLIVNGQEIARGKSALIAHLSKRSGAGTPKLRHWTTNLLIAGDGSSARLRAYVMAFRIEDSLGPPYIMGEYDDTLLKIEGSWKFKIRHMTVVAGTSTTGR